MNIKSWCQEVLDLLDLSFAELLGITWNIPFSSFLGLCIMDRQFANFFCAFLMLSIFFQQGRK